LKGIVLSIDGSEAVEGKVQGPVSTGRELGNALAKTLKKEGAEQILAKVIHASKN
jgi:porphobilinogen deaminase